MNEADIERPFVVPWLIAERVPGRFTSAMGSFWRVSHSELLVHIELSMSWGNTDRMPFTVRVGQS